jgi:endonuclease YncB( thermonuclease family)
MEWRDYMKNKWLPFLVCLMLWPALFAVAQLSGRVVAITDGDSFRLLTADSVSVRIRLAGIDAPEKGQPYSAVCKSYLSKLIFGKTLTVHTLNKDRFGRQIAIAWLGPLCVNEEMLRDGMAWHFKKYDQNPKWSALETEARRKRIGLWADGKAVAPWEWRNIKKKSRS